jgi:PKD repeat protein
MNRRCVWASALAQACALLAFLVCGVPAASAVVVHTPNGQFLGILPHHGIAGASIPGSIAALHRANFSSNGNLNYHGGPVVHSSAAYLIFWTPSGFSIPGSSQTLLKRYFSDAAADSGKPSNAFAVARQFTDASGFANYMQTFTASSQAISDSQAYPPLDSAHCPQSLPVESYCVTDAQIRAELQRLTTSLGLPTDGSATASSLPANAPIFFVVLPSTVNVCATASSCADNIFCAYHSSFNDAGNNVLYAAIPFLPAAQFPKACQFDGNTPIQQPNRDPVADVALKFLSHEHNEVITDPTGAAWFDGTSGNENGDNCNATGPANPGGGTSPNAFLPVLGGSASLGTLYDQRLAGNPYYLQSEWSNGDTGCEMAPTAGTIVPRFTVPSSSTEGSPASFDPSASTSTNPLSSATWDFGDGTAPAFRGASSPLASVSHTYSAGGTYTVTLTLVDNRGNLATTTRQITVDEAPTAAFTSTPPHPAVAQTVSFDGSSSSDPDGSIMSYSWNFGDGTPAATGTTPTHTYSTSGVYTITLKVSDSSGATATTTQQLPVGLIASFTVTSPPPLLQGQALGFDGTGSSTSQGATITSYSWDFGDGSAPGTSPTPSHAYLHYGSYTVKLTVTDSSSATDTAAQTVVVHPPPPTAGFTVRTAIPVAGQPVAFDGSSSDDPNGPITSYSWSFGDGSTGTGATLSHIYSSYGTYTVALTVTDSNGLASSVSQHVVVDAAPIASFTFSPRRPLKGTPVAFDASSSSHPTDPFISYRWSFGDGRSASGARPRHVFRNPRSFRVALTVTDRLGASTTTVALVRVGVAGRITRLSLRAGAGGATLLISVNAPGVVSAGHRSVRIRRSGIVRLPVALNPAQMQRLASNQAVSIHLRLRFAPWRGPSMRLPVTITFRAPPVPNGRLNTTLHRH